MAVNWQKVSEIFLDSALQAIISAALVIITFRLGQWQSDRNWQRKISHEITVETKQRRLKALLDIFHLVNANKDVLIYIHSDYFQSLPEERKERIKVVRNQAPGLIRFALSLFDKVESPDLFLEMEDLVEFLDFLIQSKYSGYGLDLSGRYLTDKLNFLTQTISLLEHSQNNMRAEAMRDYPDS
jgi:hypothetical protein